MFENIGEIILLFWRTILALPLVWRQRHKVLDQFFEIGNASLLMVCMLSFFIGGVIALNFGPTLVERSFTSAVGGVVEDEGGAELAGGGGVAELDGMSWASWSSCRHPREGPLLLGLLLAPLARHPFPGSARRLHHAARAPRVRPSMRRSAPRRAQMRRCRA